MKHNLVAKYLEVTLKSLTGLTAAGYIVFFLYLSFARINFPYALDWVEGASLSQTYQLIRHGVLYAPPSLSYIPMVYQPLYFYIAVPLTKLMGLGFAPLRLISILASLGSMVFISLTVQRQTQSWHLGLVSAGFFAATNHVVRTWFDSARVDMLYLFFLLGGVYFLSRATRKSALAAGLFFALAFFTKQTAVTIFGPLLICFLLWQPRKAWPGMILCGVICLAGVGLLYWSSQGWYWYYAVILPSKHAFTSANPPLITPILDLASDVWPMGLVACIPFIFGVKSLVRDKNYLLIAAFVIVAIGTSALGLRYIGAARNIYIPAYASLTLLFGLGWKNAEKTLPRQIPGIALSVILTIFSLYQFYGLRYDAREVIAKQKIPNQADWKIGQKALQAIQAANGRVFMPTHNYLMIYAGKEPYYHEAALWELNGTFSHVPAPELELLKEEVAALAAQEKITVLLESPTEEWLGLQCKNTGDLVSKSKLIPTLYIMRCLKK
jgi:hypothetical protein